MCYGKGRLDLRSSYPHIEEWPGEVLRIHGQLQIYLCLIQNLSYPPCKNDASVEHPGLPHNGV